MIIKVWREEVAVYLFCNQDFKEFQLRVYTFQMPGGWFVVAGGDDD
jgi:hypothetical protein